MRTSPMLVPCLLAAGTLAGLTLIPTTVADAQTTQPSWSGTTTQVTRVTVPGLGGSSAVVGYVPGTDDVVLAATSGSGAGERIRIVAARQSPTTGRLAALGGCLAFPATTGCTTLPEAPASVNRIQFSADGTSVHVVGTGVLTLARDTSTGALRALPSGGCLAPVGAASCRTPGGTAVSLALPAAAAAAPGVLADGTSLRLVSRDPASGALAFTPGPAACLSAAPAAGCTEAPGAGTRPVVTSADGRTAYAAGLSGRDVSIFRATSDGVATLTAPAPPLVVPAACPTGEECVAPDPLLAPDGGHLYLTHPVRSLDAPDPRVPSLAFAVGADGALSPADCGSTRCRQIVGPATFSPAGDQVYGLRYGATSGETLGATTLLATYGRDARTGRLREKDAFGVPQIGDIVESADEGPFMIAASPSGRWLLTSDLDVLHRRTAKPPTISVRGLPKKGSCLRRDARLRITIGGTSHDPKRAASADATFATSESGVSRGSRRTKAKSFTLRVKRARKAEMLVTITAPGKRAGDVSREVEFRFC